MIKLYSLILEGLRMRKNLLNLKSLKSIVKILFPMAFMVFILIEGRKELASIKPKDVEILLKSLPPYILILFVIGGILTASTSFLHDFIISKEFSVRMTNLKVFQISFISNTLNNLMGGFSSAGMRVMLYAKEGVKPKIATYYNVLLITSFSAGLSPLAVIILFNLKDMQPLFKQYEFSFVSMILVVFFIPVYFSINRINWIKKILLGIEHSKSIAYGLMSKLLLSSMMEWTMVSLFFVLISLYFSPSAKLIDLLSVFIISSVVGVLSLVPGAIGTFDVTLLLGMSIINVDSHKAVASLMIFRLFYYIVPLILALFIAIPQIFKKNIK